ncbi:putative membrane protein [Synechococcus sp. PCC 7502]|uniref:DUF2335 domain-containing protein n=1 Tax=Synechococcus sp. PCC 7502 TaxID=1173263 RepID=UPI00029FDF6F|nr:DUF2335 domain-containing protein [Synechococcus sp. PCC 7502]AFY74280.1 putative membrane protein [Synechococcus sp. PCC 7502]
MSEDTNIQPLDPKESNVVHSQEYEEQTLEFYTGQFPHPSILVEYENIVPGMVDRIVTLTEKEQAHRHTIEIMETQAQIGDTKTIRTFEMRGQTLGFILFLAVISFAGYSLKIGSEGVAIGSIVTAFIGGVTIFVKGREAEKKTDN